MSDLFTRYRITIRFTGKVMGGVPRDPKVIEGWIKSRIGEDQGDQLRALVIRTVIDMGHDLAEDPTREQLDAAITSTVADKSTNGFKRAAAGLFIEGRQVKAMLKENVHILYAKQKWGATGKGPKAYVAERVFVEEDTIPLGRTEPDGVEMFIGHVTGPQGPRSTLTYYEYCDQPEITFTVASLQDGVKLEHWDEILEQAEQNGLGALRSQGHGRFAIVGVDRLGARPRPKFFDFEKPKLKVVDAAD